MPEFTILEGDALTKLRELPDESVHCCVTSPPYFGLRDYGADGQIGLEATPADYVVAIVAVFREVRRVLRSDSTAWVNLGDSYTSGGRSAYDATARRRPADADSERETHPSAGKGRAGTPEGMKPKDLMGIPWMVAFALRADGWYLRSEIIWHKPNPMPESVTDRPTKAHEQIFLLAKSERYYYDHEAIKEQATDTGRVNGRDGRDEDPAARPPFSNPRTLKRLDYSQMGRNKRSVWTVSTRPYSGAHFATFPPDLIEPCILAGCPEGGTVLDPFNGAGTTGLVALRRSRQYIGIELNPEYATMARNRILDDSPMFNAEVAV